MKKTITCIASLFIMSTLVSFAKKDIVDTAVGAGSFKTLVTAVKAAGLVFHKACFNCCQCGKRLEPGMQSESDGDVWCRACYGKAKGPKGFGFGGGGAALRAASARRKLAARPRLSPRTMGPPSLPPLSWPKVTKVIRMRTR